MSVSSDQSLWSDEDMADAYDPTPSTSVEANVAATRPAVSAKKPRGAPKDKKPKAEKKKQNDPFANIERITPPVYDIIDPAQRIAAKAFHKENGYVVIMPFVSEEERTSFCKEAVTEIWNNIVNSAGYKPEIRAQMPMINTQEDLVDFMGQLPSHIKKQLKALLGDHHHFHMGFGATCYNTSFHSESAWRLRMDLLLASFVKTLMPDGDEAYFSIDRTISKWLNMGDQAFVHVDTAPGAERNEGTVNGKFCATNSSFICTPGSHLLTEEVKIQYEPIYPALFKKQGAAKFALNPSKQDPLGLYSGSNRVLVPAGCLILWHDNLFHGVSKNTSGAVQWGFYLGFTNNIFRTGFDYHKSGKSQVQDRYDCWRFGIRPEAHPSLDPTHLYPYKFQNFPNVLETFVKNKMDTSNPQYDFSQRMTIGAWKYPKNGGPTVWTPGHLVAHLKELPDPTYTPYPLSIQGRALLVGAHNVDDFDWGF
jgi:hypothetical protein